MKVMVRFAAVLSVAAALLIGAMRESAQAVQEQVLSRDNGVADTLEWLNQDFHYVEFVQPAGWTHVFSEEVQFYGQRYGTVGERKGTIVIWGEEKPNAGSSRAGQLNGALKVLFTKQFNLSLVPEQPDWVSIPIDALNLPSAFAVSISTYSDEANGVKLGQTATSAQVSHSSATHPGKDGKWTAFKPLRGGRNWMLRVKVRDSLAPGASLDPAELSGPNVLGFDDGSADGFLTLRKKGFLLRCDNATPRKVASVFIFGKLDGNWFGSKRMLSVMILGRDLKLLSRTQVPYSQFTNVPSWYEVKFSPVAVGTMHYISVEPGSSAGEQFMLGYDSSSSNKASSHGTTGAPLAWPFKEAAEAETNWMVRVKYAP